jgi:hypothetical protein
VQVNPIRRSKVRFEDILTEVNFRIAFYKAAKGKRCRAAVRSYQSNLTANIRRTISALNTDSFRFGECHRFLIHDPKKRLISAPRFEERVVHHAIMNLCESVFDRFLIFDSYASRVGKGRIAAVQRALKFSGQFPIAMKLDARKYFGSIEHRRLLFFLERRFKSTRLLEVFRKIISSHEDGLGVGLPIGSLISQHLANFFLGHMDRFATENLRVGAYVRYMDDIVIWGDNCASMRAIEKEMCCFGTDLLGIELKPAQVGNVATGLDFLGARIYPDHFELSSKNRRRIAKRFRVLCRYWRLGVLSDDELQRRLNSMISFSLAGGTKSWRFRSRMVDLDPGE